MYSASAGGSDGGYAAKVLPTPVPPPPPAPIIVQVQASLTPAEVYWKLVDAGTAKMKLSWFKLAVGGILAGMYVSFGFTFCCVSIGLLGNTIYGALAFPVGLFLIILCGAELYTGNTCYMFTANIERKAALWHHIKICTSAWAWNLVGSLIMVQLEYVAQIWYKRENYVHDIAHKKMSLEWHVVLVRAIFANWLVNLAVYQAVAARDVIGKAIGCWTPITTFVAIGLEHCIANMWVIPMSIYLPPTDKWPVTITWRDFVAKNLIPATIGNWIGGAIMVGALNAAFHGTKINEWKDQAYDMTVGKIVKKVEDPLDSVVDMAAPACLSKPTHVQTEQS
ncbi:hypothetical protein PLESTB_000372800 [Pleodorina starrii]|uniref:Formate/nitrite transporter n=1 Tax=Pleodorina starrii TaxID=330485 RepID=A0A9W6BEL5_9CHLO|nr:hypothetical protein PLESTM_000022100 [Pleodorina starrii]GLC50380.1 hypothetical protein PLESTB_000372800 [Pleodorina starrii]GLC64239.1 hypothetical protein PLESTF_000139900 [Pleodorina starrii]